MIWGVARGSGTSKHCAVWTKSKYFYRGWKGPHHLAATRLSKLISYHPRLCPCYSSHTDRIFILYTHQTFSPQGCSCCYSSFCLKHSSPRLSHVSPGSFCHSDLSSSVSFSARSSLNILSNVAPLPTPVQVQLDYISQLHFFLSLALTTI